MPDGERRTTTNYIPREATPEELRASFAQMWLDVHHGQHAQARPFHPREGCELCSLSRMLTSELRLKENTDWANADIVVALAPRKTSKEKVQP